MSRQTEIDGEGLLWIIGISLFFLYLFFSSLFEDINKSKTIQACLQSQGSPIIQNGELKECKR